MKRRGYLELVAAAGIPGCVDNVRSELESASGKHGPQKEFGFGSRGFESAGWTDNGQFEVSFSDDHDMDGWGFRYYAQSDANDALVLREAPDFGGTDTVDLLSEFARYSSRPPAGEYHIIAYKGAFSNRGISIVEEELGTVSFYVEPILEVQSTEMTQNHHFTATVRSSGNSPCLVNSVSVQGEETSVGSVVGINETVDITSSSTVYPTAQDDPDCIELLEDFTVALNTAPKTEVAVSMSVEHEHERACTITF